MLELLQIVALIVIVGVCTWNAHKCIPRVTSNDEYILTEQIPAKVSQFISMQILGEIDDKCHWNTAANGKF